jgi:hypothetical protein
MEASPPAFILIDSILPSNAEMVPRMLTFCCCANAAALPITATQAAIAATRTDLMNDHTPLYLTN